MDFLWIVIVFIDANGFVWMFMDLCSCNCIDFHV